MVKTGLFTDKAQLTVIEVPERANASVTSTPRDKALINLFRKGKFACDGTLLSGYSETINPFSFI